MSPPLLRRRALAGLFALFLAAFLASLPGRFLHLDDAWLGEQAYWLAEDGVVRSELFPGLLDYERRIFVFHKLFILQGAAAVRLFGWSATVLKATSLPYLALALLVLRSRASAMGLGPEGRRFAALLLVAHPLVFEYAFTFRPEVMLMALGLASFDRLERSLRGGSASVPWLAAALAGLACLTHANGLVFVAAGTVVLLVERRPRAAAGYLALSLAIASLYAADALVAGELDVLLAQLRGDRVLAGAGPFTPLARLVGEPRRWIRRGQDVGILLLVVAALWTAWPVLRDRHRTLLAYAGTSVVALGLVAATRTEKYMLAYLPLLILVAAVGYEQALLRNRERPGPARAFGWLTLAMLVCCAIVDGRKLVRNGDAAGRHAALGALIPDPDALVLAHPEFVFDELPRHRLLALRRFRLVEDPPVDLPELLDRARAEGVEYVVLDPSNRYARRLLADSPTPPEELPHFALVGRHADALVLRVE